MSYRFLLSTIACVFAGPALALDVAVEKAASAPADKVWAAVGDFCGISTWHPAVEKCALSTKGSDTFRTLTLKGGGTILEKQTGFDTAAMTYSYTIEESPLPVKSYVATLSVKPKGQGSSIRWTATFDAKGAPDADAVKTITGIFEAGAAALQATK